MATSETEIPTCRWGIVTTGLISSWFVADLLLAREPQHQPRPAKHIIHAIGSSSLAKGRAFAAKFGLVAAQDDDPPKIYGSYDQVYADPDVDCVYVGTPHAFHKRDCLAAIAAGKNVLCEKAFTLNAREARDVFAAAAATAGSRRQVYVAEAMWLRHRPLVADLRRLLHRDKVIGDVFRATCDFQMYLDLASLPPTSRYKDPRLGAGALLDIGVYALTWLLLLLEDDDPGAPAGRPETPTVLAAQSFRDGVEVTTSAVLRFPSTQRQGVLLATTERGNGERDAAAKVVATVDGTDGFVEVLGAAPSHPAAFVVYPKWTGSQKPEGKKYDYANAFQGFIYEADNTALDIRAGRKESEIMPWAETVRVMEIMDEIRSQGGTRYAQDEDV